MPLETPEKWYKPFNREERIWMAIILVWGFIMFLMMPLGHLGKQNVSSETYKTTPDEFRKTADKFIEKYQVRDKDGKRVFRKGIAVVEAPEKEKGDAFLVARSWQYYPILVLRKNKTYRIHMSSLDLQHGFSLQPQNLNFQLLPYYDFVITMSPTETGTSYLICNEYCGYVSKVQAHDTMIGQIIVKE